MVSPVPLSPALLLPSLLLLLPPSALLPLLLVPPSADDAAPLDFSDALLSCLLSSCFFSRAGLLSLSAVRTCDAST